MKSPIFLISTIAISILLVGCATTSQNTTAPTATYAPASNVAQQKIVTQYVPVPVPGQLMPAPNQANATATPTFQTAQAAVDYANKQATQVPNSSQFFNSMMTYDYMPGSLYTIYTAPMRITDIALAPGEKLVSEAAGDTLRWQIAQTYSGTGDSLTQHILVKPSQSDLTNTMVITTDQRVYHLVLQSTDQSYMASVQWNYPGNNNLVSYPSDLPSPGADPNTSSSPDVDLTNLDFNYHIALTKGSGQPAWYPTRVFNDGKQMFIQLPPNYSTSQLPVVYVMDENGNYATMVNWRYRAPYIIIDVIAPSVRLQSGVESTGQTIVQIDHT